MGANTGTNPGEAVFSLVDGLERTETFCALLCSTLNTAGNKINKINFAPSWYPLRDRQEPRQVHDDVWPSAAQARQLRKSPRLTPCGCGILSRNVYVSPGFPVLFGQFLFFLNPSISLSPSASQYFNRNSGNFRGERTSSSDLRLPSSFHRWGN